jgi:uncharacterized protein YjbI with pentapeptide repeats
MDAHLEGANLIGANLEGADLGSAHLEGANLISAQLAGANLGGAQLEGALADVHTSWPAGFDRRAAGVIIVEGEDSPASPP